MLGVDHDKNILLSTPFPTIPMLGTNCWCNVIVFYVGNKRCCIVLYCIVRTFPLSHMILSELFHCRTGIVRTFPLSHRTLSELSIVAHDIVRTFHCRTGRCQNFSIVAQDIVRTFPLSNMTLSELFHRRTEHCQNCSIVAQDIVRTVNCRT